jgi:hypothetical protein
MKKLILLSALFVIALGVNAQNGTLKSPAFDTLNGNETVYFPVVTVTGDYLNLSITALFTELGGTSDGTMQLQYSAGANYETVLQTSELFEFVSNDTTTITDGGVFNVIIRNPPVGQYRLKGVGTASDTTLVTPQYRLK